MKQLMGTTNKALLATLAKVNLFASSEYSEECMQNLTPVKSVFFCPVESGLDLMGRIAAIVTAPLCAIADLLSLGLTVLSSFINIIKNSIALEFDSCWQLAKVFNHMLLSTVVAVPFVVLSPLIEVIDVIGSSISACMPDSEDSEIDQDKTIVFN